MVPLNECPLRYATVTRRLWRSNARHHLRSALSDCSAISRKSASATDYQRKNPPQGRVSCIGAAEKNRTFDPVITNDVLYQ